MSIPPASPVRDPNRRSDAATRARSLSGAQAFPGHQGDWWRERFPARSDCLLWQLNTENETTNCVDHTRGRLPLL